MTDRVQHLAHCAALRTVGMGVALVTGVVPVGALFERLIAHRVTVNPLPGRTSIARTVPPARRRLEKLVDDLETGTTVRPHLVKGLAQRVIPRFARETGRDLIVMGTVARTGMQGFLIGNTAESVLTQVDTGLLFVKPPGFTVPFPPDD